VTSTGIIKIAAECQQFCPWAQFLSQWTDYGVTLTNQGLLNRHLVVPTHGTDINILVYVHAGALCLNVHKNSSILLRVRHRRVS